MAKPNYSFEKRQKELAKKKKQEEKMAEKRLRKANPDGEQLPADEFENSTDADATAETAADDSTEPSSQS